MTRQPSTKIPKQQEEVAKKKFKFPYPCTEKSIETILNGKDIQDIQASLSYALANGLADDQKEDLLLMFLRTLQANYGSVAKKFDIYFRTQCPYNTVRKLHAKVTSQQQATQPPETTAIPSQRYYPENNYQ